MGILHLRLKNCLQTILDLEPSIHKGYMADFAADFSKLRSYLACVESMELAEEDVERLEKMTCELLQEGCFTRGISPLMMGRLQ